MHPPARIIATTDLGAILPSGGYADDIEILLIAVDNATPIGADHRVGDQAGLGIINNPNELQRVLVKIYVV
jgi:hypothetical protein